jgi:aspartate/methionine/tyrosine aminotransferase
LKPSHLSTALTALSESATVALADRVRQLRASGRDIIPLQTGDPDFPTPEPIVEAARQAIRRGYTHYSFSRGLPELREAIVKVMGQQGTAYSPETEILVTHGGVHAYHCGLQAILNPGDEVLVPDPAWMTHVNMAVMLGGAPVRVPSYAADGFVAGIDAWEAAITERTSALVVNFPNNPTGCVPERTYLERLLEFAQRHHLYVISDEVYDHILFDGRRHTSFASLPGAHERTLLVNSFSKTYAMSGWRIGWLAGPSGVIDQALKATQNSITCLAPFVQKAAAFALADPDMNDAARRMGREYERRRDMTIKAWEEERVQAMRPIKPDGAFYIFWDARALRRPSLSIAESLLEDAGVSVVPGGVYGAQGEGFLRTTLAADEPSLLEGTRRMAEWCAKQGISS